MTGKTRAPHTQFFNIFPASSSTFSNEFSHTLWKTHISTPNLPTSCGKLLWKSRADPTARHVKSRRSRRGNASRDPDFSAEGNFFHPARPETLWETSRRAVRDPRVLRNLKFRASDCQAAELLLPPRVFQSLPRPQAPVENEAARISRGGVLERLSRRTRPCGRVWRRGAKEGRFSPRFSESVRGKGFLPPPRNIAAYPAPVLSGQGFRRPAAGTPFHPEQNLPEFSQEITTPTDSPTVFILYILFIFSLFIAREKEDSAGAGLKWV